MKIKVIAAVDAKGGIGLQGKLPWNYPEDLRRFRETTLNHTVVMGKTTWLSIPGRHLSGRRNVVITRDPRAEFETFYSGDIHHQKPAVEFYSHPGARGVFESEFQTGDIYFIGGASIYKEILSYPLVGVVDEIILTQIPGDYSCDKFFPSLPVSFKLQSRKVIGELTYETYTPGQRVVA